MHREKNTMHATLNMDLIMLLFKSKMIHNFFFCHLRFKIQTLMIFFLNNKCLRKLNFKKTLKNPQHM